MSRSKRFFTATALAAAALLCAVQATACPAHAEATLSTEQAATNAALIEATAQLRGKALPYRQAEPVMPFVLCDQNGNPVQLPTAFEGKFIVVSFIFTRCQVATMCPAATSKMTQLQRKLDALGLADTVQLVSISFDPGYDTPEVMRQYAHTFGADTANYAFLTGEPEVTHALLQRFGILTRNTSGTIVHTMTTSLIGPDGRLALQQSGADWQPESFLAYISEHTAPAR